MSSRAVRLIRQIGLEAACAFRLPSPPNREIPGFKVKRFRTALAQLPGVTGYWVSPDWVELTYPAWALAESNRLYVEGQWAGPAPAGPRKA